MKLTLLINGVEKEFTTGNQLPAIIFKRSLVVAESFDKNENTLEALDNAIVFIADELFHKQFTAEEFWSGVDSSDLMTVVAECLQHPAKMVQSKFAELKN